MLLWSLEFMIHNKSRQRHHCNVSNDVSGVFIVNLEPILIFVHRSHDWTVDFKQVNPSWGSYQNQTNLIIVFVRPAPNVKTGYEADPKFGKDCLLSLFYYCYCYYYFYYYYYYYYYYIFIHFIIVVVIIIIIIIIVIIYIFKIVRSF